MLLFMRNVRLVSISTSPPNNHVAAAIQTAGAACLAVDELHSRADELFNEFKEGGGSSCIEEAIDLDREALVLCPASHRKRSEALASLATHLHSRYEWLGHSEDLEEALALNREAFYLRPQGHQDRASSLINLAADLSARYNLHGAMQDLDEAIVLDREALDLRPPGHRHRSRSLINLAVDLSTRYKQLGVIQDLAEAIALNREALYLRPKGDPKRSRCLNNLAANLSARHKQLGTMQDLDEAIALSREALGLQSKSHPDHPKSLNNLAAHLHTRYKQFGTMQDLDEAIALDREALQLLPNGHPNRFMSLSNLAVDLSTRYEQLEIMQDLDNAICLQREALGLMSEGHPSRSMSLSSLAGDLSTRYRCLSSMQDLSDAITLNQEALVLRPEGHPDRSMSLNNLAGDLSTRYKLQGDVQDLDAAISLGREALSLRPRGHRDRPESLNNLSGYLSFQYKRLGTIQDLEEAIILCRETLDLQPQGHSNRSTTLQTLAQHLCDLYRQSGQQQVKEEIFSFYGQLAQPKQFVSSADIAAVRAWIKAAEEFDHPTLLVAHETGLRLLIRHIATLPPLPQHHVILKNHTGSLAVDAFSVCLKTFAPQYAVELLEQGRGVFWNQLTRFRSPLDDVMESGPAGKTLAGEFMDLAQRIRNTLHMPGTDQHEQLFHLNLKMQEIMTKIQRLPGLSRFLLPPYFSDLQRAADQGPIIILNASKYSCDALIIFLERDPEHIPLRITREDVRKISTDLHSLTVRAKREDITKELACFLRELWDQIVSHIAGFLQPLLPRQSRIWWCPTSEFSLLPLHAAGPYRNGQLNFRQLYISSYTPTISALMRARRFEPSSSTAREKRFVAIGQSKAVGENELLSVDSELDSIRLRVNGLAVFTRIDGDDSCTSRVVQELGRNEWVHLACHGLANPTHPFESAFALGDGRFTVQQIIGYELKSPEFAYLSACHTTVGDEEGLDEVIHLASAMQFIGFRSVIGTMWAVDDGETNQITSTFYKHMVDESGRLDYTRAAFALNRTMKKSVDVPFDQQVLYIHLGA